MSSIPGCVWATITTFVSKIRPQSSSLIDLESQQVTNPVLAPEIQDHILLQWKNIVMAFCLTAAIEISILFAQTAPLSVSFHVLSLAVLVTFLFLFVSNFIAHKFARTARRMEKIAVYLVATVVVFTITIPLPLSLTYVAWTLYGISLMVILICRYYCF